MKKAPQGSGLPPNPRDAVICVDMGTTNTRVWLVVGKEIVARESASIGVRDSARTGNTNIIHRALKDLFAASQAEALSLDLKPALVLGAGMITSSLGLLEIDHVPAPAGEPELARSMRQLSSPQVTELPIWLVPGVRTGPAHPEIADLSEMDVIRGEETLCVGLTRLGMLGPHSTLLNLGSHWKAITLDGSGRIVSSFTTLSGELIHAVQKHTVLSSALPQERFTELDLYWLEQGRAQQKMAGLSRALFCVRILQQKFGLTPLQLSSFLLGVVVGSDLTAARQNHKLAEAIVIAGAGAAADAWKQFLEGEKLAVSVCDPQGVEAAFVAGLLRLAELAPSPGV
jgi:2-dehydro-3-deoxygalactonokinase